MSEQFEAVHCEMSVVAQSDDMFHFTSRRNELWTDPRINYLASAEKKCCLGQLFFQLTEYFYATPLSSHYLGYID